MADEIYVFYTEKTIREMAHGSWGIIQPEKVNLINGIVYLLFDTFLMASDGFDDDLSINDYVQIRRDADGKYFVTLPKLCAYQKLDPRNISAFDNDLYLKIDEFSLKDISLKNRKNYKIKLEESISDIQLSKNLNLAIQDEDYEEASKIRDELKRRGINPDS